MNRLLLFIIILSSVSAHGQTSPKSEFRGVWIATVANIDWPSRGGLPSEVQQSEFAKILDMHKTNGMNAVVVQVRPAADAFYPSPYEPWSKWLTGKTGKYPQPYYDPLAFMIREAHSRGMEFHAWFNPYRASSNEPDSGSIVHQHPERFLKYGKNMYFNPGLTEVRQHVTNVVMDVVNHYDIDGVHFDDYFYPYRIAGETFPDSVTFANHANGFTDKDDWRRNNVDLLIKKISDSIRSVKPHVKFGISPFGVWRNQSKDPLGSATRGGQTCYDDLYADVRKWLKEGWIDYVTPQIYWPFGHEAAAYEVLLDWWTKNNFDKPILIGHGAYRVDSLSKDERWRDRSQMPRQIRAGRLKEGVKGNIFFSSKSFKPNPLGLSDSLRLRLYRKPALPLAKERGDGNSQAAIVPTFSVETNVVRIRWPAVSAATLGDHAQYVVYRTTTPPSRALLNANTIMAIIPNDFTGGSVQRLFEDRETKRGRTYYYVVTSIDKWGGESSAKAYGIRYKRNGWKVYPPLDLP